MAVKSAYGNSRNHMPTKIITATADGTLARLPPILTLHLTHITTRKSAYR